MIKYERRKLCLILLLISSNSGQWSRACIMLNVSLQPCNMDAVFLFLAPTIH